MNEIAHLTQHVERVQENLRIDRQRRKAKPNQNMDKDFPDRMASFDFWCDVCHEDFEAPARKSRYRLEGDVIATMRGKCPVCETEAIRHATHRDQDPYYRKSLKIRKQRNQYTVDLLQGKEYGFKTHYGDPDQEFQNKMMLREERIIGEERSIGLRGKSLKTQEKLKKLYSK